MLADGYERSMKDNLQATPTRISWRMIFMAVLGLLILLLRIAFWATVGLVMLLGIFTGFANHGDGSTGHHRSRRP
jgi:hypothetical protein